VAGIQEAQQRWQSIRSKGRTRGIAALVVVVVVLLAIAALAGGNAAPVVLVVLLVVVVIGAIALVLGKKQTGLSITPEWKPADTHDDEVDEDLDEDDNEAPAVAPTTAEDVEPVRRLDAQILGSDLTKLGQVVAPKLSKSYAMGYIVLSGPNVVWEPSVASAGQGIDALSVAPAEVASVERAPLWGSWALMRIATAEGAEWCMRIPGSVDLAPAFAELGLTVRVHS
jgi:hypothetical protein